jgi:hypothetical protein
VSTLPVDGLSRGDHVCAVYQGQAAQEELVTEFVRAGLQRQERVVYFAGDAVPERVIGVLHAGGISTGEPLAQGQLVVVPLEEGGANGHGFDPTNRIAGMDAAIDAALAEGYSGLRATGEHWTSRELPSEEVLAEYEAQVGELCAARSAVGLCQYDSSRCDSAMLDRLRALHGHVVRNPLVSRNELLRIIPLAHDHRGEAWLRVVGEADLSSSALLQAALDEPGRGDLHLDLDRLRFVDLRGVEALQDLAAGLRAARRRLILHNSPTMLRRIVELADGSLPDAEMSAR